MKSHWYGFLPQNQTLIAEWLKWIDCRQHYFLCWYHELPHWALTRLQRLGFESLPMSVKCPCFLCPMAYSTDPRHATWCRQITSNVWWNGFPSCVALCSTHPWRCTPPAFSKADGCFGILSNTDRAVTLYGSPSRPTVHLSVDQVSW